MEKFCNVILETYFGNIIVIKSRKWCHNWFFEVRFRHQFKKTQFGQIT